MDTGKLHHYWRQLQRLKIWVLVGLLIVFGTLSAVLLRHNNVGMVERRKAVLEADKSNGDVTGKLNELRRHVLTHMNTKMAGPVQLQYSYERAVQAEVDQQSSSGSTTDAAAYQRAQDECKTASTVAYAQCVIDKTSQVAPGSNPVTQLQLPPAELFSYSFHSPTWSPDAAGFAVLGFVFTLLLLVLRVAAERLAWALLRFKR